ncbi:hypothetical protein HDU88_000635, partial [Geranomyces variabilis]
MSRTKVSRRSGEQRMTTPRAQPSPSLEGLNSDTKALVDVIQALRGDFKRLTESVQTLSQTANEPVPIIYDGFNANWFVQFLEECTYEVSATNACVSIAALEPVFFEWLKEQDAPDIATWNHDRLAAVLSTPTNRKSFLKNMI